MMKAIVRSTPGLKAIIAGIVLAFFALFIVNTFIQSPPSRQRAAGYFSAEEIDRGVQAVASAVLAKEIPVPGLDHGDEMSPGLEQALQDFIKKSDSGGWEY